MTIPKNKQLGLFTLTMLVAGNMIGSGIFLLPSSLAEIGSITLLSWGLTSIGAFILAIIFSRMSLMIPKTGGPYAYAEAGFGTFIGFQTAYNYWITIWVGNAAIAIAMAGYLNVFLGFLSDPWLTALLAILAIWILTFVNIRGVRLIALIQNISTLLKFIPILLICLFGWFYFHPEYITNSVNVSSTSNFSALSSGAALTLWAFLGLESATVPAGNVSNPKRNIPLATLFGTLIATIAYISSSVVIMGMIPAKELAVSHFPFAAAAGIIFGAWGKWIVGAGAAIACFGCLNGWTLLQGQVAMAAADDGLFPSIFAKRNKEGLPIWGLIITSGLISLLILLTVNPNLTKQFDFIILMATLSALFPYLYTSVAAMIVVKNVSFSHLKTKSYHVICILGVLYSFWAIFGSGKEIVFCGSMLMLISVPLYVLVNHIKKRKKTGDH